MFDPATGGIDYYVATFQAIRELGWQLGRHAVMPQGEAEEYIRREIDIRIDPHDSEENRQTLVEVFMEAYDDGVSARSEWQRMEREADADVAAGRVARFNDVDGLIADLES